MSRIFLSHSSANNGPAIALRDWLANEGWEDVFLDLDPQRGIVAGERWERALTEAAYRCEAVLFLVSQAWLQSQWCIREFHLAAKLNKRMFGLLIDNVSIDDLPAELASTWQFVDLNKGTDHALFRVALPDGREEHVTFSKSALARLKSGLMKAGLDPRFFAWPPPSDPERPPYRGLRPLEAEDAGIFFGREAPIIETLDRLRGLRDAAPPRFLAILGASGAGKSSFLKAGLIPRLARDDRNFLVLPVIRPERAVISGEMGLIRSFEHALKTKGLKHARADVKKAIAGGFETVLPLLAALVGESLKAGLADAGSPRMPTLVLAVDQGEELFQAEGAEEARDFLALIRDLVLARSPDLIFLATIRSDAYERLQTATALEGIRQHTLSLPPLPKGAYQMVIEGPVQRLEDTPRALKLDPALTDALLSDIDAGGAKDALPLLAFTLERLYLEHGGDGDLKLSEYREIGGIAGSIEAAVARALKAADADPAVPKDHAARLALIRRAFIPWLAGIDPESGSPRRAIARLSEIPEESRPIVQHLIDQRLLATDVAQSGERTIEPAHEALLRQWGLLQGWLQEDFAKLSALEALKRTTRDWLANGKSPDWLAHAAGRLEDAESIITRPDLAQKLDTADREYLAQCRAGETQRKDKELNEARRLVEVQTLAARRTRIGAVVALLLAVIAGAIGIWGWENARRAEAEKLLAEQNEASSRTNETIGLAAMSQAAALRKDYGSAVMLALAGWPRGGDDKRPVRQEVIAALSDSLPFLHEIGRIDLATSAQEALYAPKSEIIIVRPARSPIQVRNKKDLRLVRTLGENAEDFWSIALSPDETLLAAGTGSGELKLYQLSDGKLLASVKAHSDGINDIAFAPDGSNLATGAAVWSKTHENSSAIWSVPDLKLVIELADHVDSVSRVRYSPDGSAIATSGSRNLVSDAHTGKTIWSTSHNVTMSQPIDFIDNGKVVATWLDGPAEAIDLNSGTSMQLAVCDRKAYIAHVSHDRSRILVICHNQKATVLDANTLNPVSEITGRSIAGTAAFSFDGRLVATSNWQGWCEVFDTATGKRIVEITGHTAAISSLGFTQANELITTSDDETVRIWDNSANESTFHAGVGKITRKPDLSRDGKEIGIPDGGQISVFDFDTGVTHSLTPEGLPDALSFSPDRRRLAAVGLIGDLFIVSNPQGETLHRVENLDAALVAYSPKGDLIAVATQDGLVKILDAQTTNELFDLGRVTGGASFRFQGALAFSPDGTKLAAGTYGVVKIWQVQDRSLVLSFNSRAKTSNWLAFSPDGTRIAAAGGVADSTEIWNVSPDAKQPLLRLFDRNSDVISFSPDGKRLVSGNDMWAYIWDASTGAAIAHRGPIKDEAEWVSFNAKGDAIITLSKQGALETWPADTGTQNAFQHGCHKLSATHSLDAISAKFGLVGLKPICGPGSEPLTFNADEHESGQNP